MISMGDLMLFWQPEKKLKVLSNNTSILVAFDGNNNTHRYENWFNIILTEWIFSAPDAHFDNGYSLKIQEKLGFNQTHSSSFTELKTPKSTLSIAKSEQGIRIMPEQHFFVQSLLV